MTGRQVAAVIVTFNRKALLCRCLAAIQQQTHAVDHIFIFNNASTDGTDTLLNAPPWSRDPAVSAIHSAQNVGGAGGFHQAIKRAYAEGYEWLWIMDDDTIPRSDCLQQLLAGRERCLVQGKPLVLASKVVWKDGTPHPMNLVGTKFHYDKDRFYETAALGCLSIRCASFVSCAIHRDAVETFGLPVAEYFIWADDIEYTARILRQNYGICVPASVADHLTNSCYGPLDAHADRFFYFVRNEFLTLRCSPAYGRTERLTKILRYLSVLARWVFKTGRVGTIIRGLSAGFTRARRVRNAYGTDVLERV